MLIRLSFTFNAIKMPLNTVKGLLQNFLPGQVLCRQEYQKQTNQYLHFFLDCEICIFIYLLVLSHSHDPPIIKPAIVHIRDEQCNSQNADQLVKNSVPSLPGTLIPLRSSLTGPSPLAKGVGQF